MKPNGSARHDRDGQPSDAATTRDDRDGEPSGDRGTKKNRTPGCPYRANRPFPRALRCDPWWTIRGIGEPFEPIFAELMYGLEPRHNEIARAVRRQACALAWGPAIGITSRRQRRTMR